VVVRHEDLIEAKSALAEIRASQSDFDWSQVDVEDRETP